MKNATKKIILGSNSPRRRELLQGLDIPFTIDTENNFIERYSADTEHSAIPQLMSRGKSYGFHRELHEDEILITADTMVLLDKYIMGKPQNREEAIDMLHKLSGHTHEVITGVTIRDHNKEKSFSDTTLVTFCEMPDDIIEYYVDKYSPYDKAGAYGIQEWIGYAAVSNIQGSFYNVMGFPVHKVYAELQYFL